MRQNNRYQPPDDGKADWALMLAWIAIGIALLAVVIAIAKSGDVS